MLNAYSKEPVSEMNEQEVEKFITKGYTVEFVEGVVIYMASASIFNPSAMDIEGRGAVYVKDTYNDAVMMCLPIYDKATGVNYELRRIKRFFMN